MKNAFAFKTILLIVALSFIQVFPSLAADKLVGSLDVFDGTQIAGWVHDESESAASEIQIRVENSITGELVKILTASPTYKRNDLVSMVGEAAEPAFTVSMDMSALPDGSYSATAYKHGQKFTNPVYYTKGEATSSLSGRTLRPLGNYRLTAYCPCRSCSSNWGRRTSSGATAAAGHTVAVDTRVIPMGSKLLINGTIYTAEDIGSAVKGNHIDIFYETHSQAKQFGVRSAEVYLVQ